MEWLSDPHAWVALLALILLEIVLGIDNIIFISILTSRMPPEQQAKARQIGLLGAMFMRVGLLFSLVWLTKLTAPLFTLLNEAISGRDLILIGGGLFLLTKSTLELHKKLEGETVSTEKASVKTSMFGVIVQIMILDLVFSLDSVITAIGMTQQLEIMVIAVIVAVLFMMAFAGKVSEFIDRHPTLKVLALSFLILIGVALIAEGLDMHIPKGYIYFAMIYALIVEVINTRIRKRNAALTGNP